MLCRRAMDRTFELECAPSPRAVRTFGSPRTRPEYTPQLHSPRIGTHDGLPRQRGQATARQGDSTTEKRPAGPHRNDDADERRRTRQHQKREGHRTRAIHAWLTQIRQAGCRGEPERESADQARTWLPPVHAFAPSMRSAFWVEPSLMPPRSSRAACCATTEACQLSRGYFGHR